MSDVVIVDYGLGNLFSVQQALEHIGCSVRCSSVPEDIESASRIVLPGVGAFSDGISGIRAKGLDNALQMAASSGRPILGICLGMQMLFDASLEFGFHEGLGILPGTINPIPNVSAAGGTLRVPHMGWNSLMEGKRSWSASILDSVPSESAVYFAHSFAYMPHVDDELALALTWYGGHPLAAVVSRGNIIGVQFHPERSGEIGLRILSSFAKC